MGVRQMDQSLERWELGVKDVQRRMTLAPTPRERWRALWLLAQGWTVAAKAEMPDRAPHTIGRWRRLNAPPPRKRHLCRATHLPSTPLYLPAGTGNGEFQAVG